MIAQARVEHGDHEVEEEKLHGPLVQLHQPSVHLDHHVERCQGVIHAREFMGRVVGIDAGLLQHNMKGVEAHIVDQARVGPHRCQSGHLVVVTEPGGDHERRLVEGVAKIHPVLVDLAQHGLGFFQLIRKEIFLGQGLDPLVRLGGRSKPPLGQRLHAVAVLIHQGVFKQ